MVMQISTCKPMENVSACVCVKLPLLLSIVSDAAWETRHISNGPGRHVAACFFLLFVRRVVLGVAVFENTTHMNINMSCTWARIFFEATDTELCASVWCCRWWRLRRIRRYAADVYCLWPAHPR